MAKNTPSGNIDVAALVDDYSVEMTGKDDKTIVECSGSYVPGTRVNVTFLGNESLDMRIAAAEAVKFAGYTPVPHISARRLSSRAELEEFLGGLRAVSATGSVFVVGGDPATPMGPYEDSLNVIRTGILQQYGVRHVSISGYPEEHPDISAGVLTQALRGKAAALQERDFAGSIITQLGFDTAPVISWLSRIRNEGIDLPVRIGVPGPAGIKRLLSYAKRFGVGSSAGIAQKYGFSITNLLGTAGPGRFIRDLAQQLRPEEHGQVGLHFYTFGGLKATGEWIQNFKDQVS